MYIMQTGQKQYNDRIKICKTCVNYLHATGQCKKCWCFMHIKARLKNSKCPESKW